ncbi:MAG: adenosylcobinamide amidohydrolase [Tumebacillaceae bacterium]
MSDDWVQSRLVDGALIVSGSEPFTILGSALFGGGFQKKRHLANIQVPLDYGCDDALFDVEKRVGLLDVPAEETAAMMTAAFVHQVVERSAEGEQFRLRCYLTAGVSNAARAGVKRKTYPGYQAGTINIIMVIDGRLSEAAFVNAVITITEAKTAALQELGICDPQGRSATGTTTDAVIVAATQNEQYSGVHQYVGVATELGNAMAEVVYESLLQSVRGYWEYKAKQMAGAMQSATQELACEVEAVGAQSEECVSLMVGNCLANRDPHGK